MIIVCGLLPCLSTTMTNNNDVSSLWAFCFHFRSSSIKIYCCKFLVNVFTKGLYLTSTNPTLSIFNGEIPMWLVLDIR